MKSTDTRQLAIVATVGAAGTTTAVFPVLARQAKLTQPFAYWLTGLHLGSSITQGAGTSAVAVVVGTDQATATLSESIEVLATHLVSGAAGSASQEGGLTFNPPIFIPANKAISLYAALVAAGGASLAAVCSLQLVKDK